MGRHDREGGHRGGGGGAAQALAGLLGLGGGGAGALAAMASLAHSQIHETRPRDSGDRDRAPAEASYQMSVPNELIGSVIGELTAVKTADDDCECEVKCNGVFCYRKRRQ